MLANALSRQACEDGFMGYAVTLAPPFFILFFYFAHRADNECSQ